MQLSREILAGLCRRPANPQKAQIWDGYVDALVSDAGTELFRKFGITTQQRMAHVLAQWAHESGGFTLKWESGAYSASRILQIFGTGNHSARVTPSEAVALAGDGPALFDRVYGLGNPRKAKELGNTKPGDGWRFRGCGIVQLTGRAAHERYAKKIGCSVDDLQEPLNAIHGALLEWDEKKCNGPADLDNIERVTKLVNGGQNGIVDRRRYLSKAKKLLATTPFKIPAADTDTTTAPAPVAKKKTIRETIKKSPSLKIQINAWLSFIGGLFIVFKDWVLDWGYWFMSFLPGAATDISTTVSSVREVAEPGGVELSAQLLFGVTAVCFAILFARQLIQKRSAS